MAVWKIKERNELVRANKVKGTRGLLVVDLFHLQMSDT